MFTDIQHSDENKNSNTMFLWKLFDCHFQITYHTFDHYELFVQMKIIKTVSISKEDQGCIPQNYFYVAYGESNFLWVIWFLSIKKKVIEIERWNVSFDYCCLTLEKEENE